MGGLASTFENLLGGGPSPEQVQQAKEAARHAPPSEPQRVDRVQAFLDAENEQRAKALQALSQVAGRVVISEEDARMQEESGSFIKSFF